MTDYSKLTVVKLREELKRRDLSHAGLKAVLVARLDEDDAAQPAPDAPEQPEEQSREQPQEEPAPPAAEAPQPEARPSKGDAPIVQAADASEQDAQMTDAPGPSAPAKEAETSKSKEGSDDANEPAAESTPRAGPCPPAPKQDDEEQRDDLTPVKKSEAADPAIVPQATVPPSSAPVTTMETQEDSQAPRRRQTENTQFSTQTSVGPEEVLEDSKKRKRRSRSPVLLTQDVAMKRLRTDDRTPRSQTPEIQGAYTMQTSDGEQGQPVATAPSDLVAKPSPADARFKSLFASGQGSAAAEQQSNRPASDRDVAPAVHPATTALYIRNLMRPLQAPTLKDHLSSLARPDGGADEDPTAEFFLDGIKSHCLVQFHDVSAASRVRQALHGTVWPDEKSRKALWVDFVPEEKLKTWMEVEQKAAGSRPPKRFEVVYEEENGETVAYLQEGDSGPRRVNTLDSRNGASSAPSSAPPVPADAALPKGDMGKGFQALDDLFKSTAAKPKLYFQPVSEDVARRRLDRLADGRGGGRGGDEMRRFTFEDGAMLVDNGPEFRPGYRGAGPPRGGRGGGYPPRGARGGDSWRGGW